jgi:hypothetical protein
MARSLITIDKEILGAHFGSFHHERQSVLDVIIVPL